MSNVSFDDAIFLLGEKAGQPSHVIALQLWDPPPGEDPEWLMRWYEQLLAIDRVRPAFAKVAEKARLSPSRYRWREELPQMDSHVRRVALPAPGRVRELLELVSYQHGVPLDRAQPLWEYHLIEGLADGRVATTWKTHHSIADGMSLARYTLGGLSTDPDSRDCAPPWVPREPRPTLTPVRAHQGQGLLDAVRAGSRGAVDSTRLGWSTTRKLIAMAREEVARMPFEAPASVLNQPVTSARRFAGDTWERARFKAVAERAGCGTNDVVLSVCGGALRRYLLEIGELPDKDLVAMVPISLRRDGDPTPTSANAFGAILCGLGTDQPDPTRRLSSIVHTMVSGKQRFASMTVAEASMLSRVLMGGAVVNAAGLSLPRQPFNLILSTVPAGETPLYYNGAKMSDIYPISMISGGQALNITIVPYVDQISIGIVGDRRALPGLQRLLVHLDQELTAHERSTE